MAIISEYKQFSSMLLGGLDCSYRIAGQSDIRTREICEDVFFLVRTQQEAGGVNLKYGMKFCKVDRLLSLKLRPWLLDRPDPFKKAWCCLYWREMSMRVPEFPLTREDPALFALVVENVFRDQSNDLRINLNLAWKHKLIDGLSKYEWVAAALIEGDNSFMNEIFDYFASQMPNSDEYRKKIAALKGAL